VRTIRAAPAWRTACRSSLSPGFVPAYPQTSQATRRGRLARAWRNPALAERLRTANAAAQLVLRSDIEFAFKHGSDHWPFHAAGVPALLLTTSRYPEYHTRQDLPELVSRDMVERVTRLVTDLARDLAASAERFPRPLEFEVPYPRPRAASPGPSGPK